ncbi:MAG: amidohydrolase [Oenococcus sp.]|uniref:M20 metallopeptidase family protein n=1 Tax=Oenococcus sp. TaxID=1979414 RepID=UPI0039E9A4CC
MTDKLTRAFAVSLGENDFEQALKQLFYSFHAHPELSGQEIATTKRITEVVSSLGLRLFEKQPHTGLIGQLDNGDGPTIALRADIDALPIQENTELSYRSVNEAVAHACGHDMHIVSLLGGLYLLQHHRDQWRGHIRILFEPSEEKHSGAKEMIACHGLDRVQAIIGFHNMPQLPVGTLACRPGVLMASNDNFQVIIHGLGAHAAMPETSRDPIISLAAMVTALQTIRSRNIKPNEGFVLTVGSIWGGSANNVIPGEAGFKGTFRTFSKENRVLAKKRFYDIVKGIAQMNGQTVEIDWDQGPSPVYNDSKITEWVSSALASRMNVTTAEISNADDDFAVYEEKVPGLYAFMGSHGQSNLHHADMIVNPDSLIYGARFHFEGAKALLKRLQTVTKAKGGSQTL